MKQYTVPSKLEYKGKWVHNWFSNMEQGHFVEDGIIYPSVENYYQSRKFLDEDYSVTRAVQKDIANMSPQKAKQAGKKLRLRPDWEKQKILVMHTALVLKFTQPKWKERLLSTGEEELVEWNNWNDRYWGVSITDGLGKNMLGQLLMLVRANLRIPTIKL